MKTDSKIREGFHSIEILLKNKPEVIKKVLVPEAREDARMLKLLQACSDNSVAVERSKKIKKNPQAIVSSMDIGDLKDLKNYLENLSNGCLLYTSPSPRDLSTSRMPSSA